MSTNQITETLTKHQWSPENGDECTCGFRPEQANDPHLAAHQTAILEPIIQERERAAWGKGAASTGILLPTNPPKQPRNPYGTTP